MSFFCPELSPHPHPSGPQWSFSFLRGLAYPLAWGKTVPEMMMLLDGKRPPGMEVKKGIGCQERWVVSVAATGVGTPD